MSVDTRIDALVRGGAREGDVRVPPSSRYALALGTASIAPVRLTLR